MWPVPFERVSGISATSTSLDDSNVVWNEMLSIRDAALFPIRRHPPVVRIPEKRVAGLVRELSTRRRRREKLIIMLGSGESNRNSDSTSGL